MELLLEVVDEKKLTDEYVVECFQSLKSFESDIKPDYKKLYKTMLTSLYNVCFKLDPLKKNIE